ncbi:hypothetical protein [Thaumasiovibrio subtropicus]|uniref:hypothetical protein n=1 Tax=Thaumasiovibrio subtropicus TaxID=1891207 RepID=UPI000B35F570|nr:hypothetical protein [Thaumasiovibrio subtropicus]
METILLLKGLPALYNLVPTVVEALVEELDEKSNPSADDDSLIDSGVGLVSALFEAVGDVFTDDAPVVNDSYRPGSLFNLSV